ncbi:MAG: thiol-disulfide isomerase/thioredoxin [Candidatus Nanohaloarchaea archaeon]|jgi:thiol-disulfide isomerase/thioredoxin
MVERQIDWQYPVIAVAITGIIFSGILYGGFALNDYKVDSLRAQIEDVETEQRSRIIGLELSESLQKQDCRAVEGWMNTTVDDLRNLRLEVAAYESSNKINNQDYTTVKKRYMNLLLQNLIQVRNYDESCDREVVDIIYFYSDGCNGCTDQATILTEVRQQYGKDVVVYPLDTELDMQPINFLLNYYGIERYPSLVIDGEVKSGFQPKDNLTREIENRLNTTDSSLERNQTDAQ